jgi:hypothetical protein
MLKSDDGYNNYLGACVQCIADSRSFSAKDAELGRAIADWYTTQGFLTLKQRRVVEKFVMRYKKVLERHGFDVSHV